MFLHLNSRNRKRRRGNLTAPGAVRGATVLRAELDLTALGEGKDPALGVEHTLPMSPFPTVDPPLGVEDQHPLGVEKLLFTLLELLFTLLE